MESMSFNSVGKHTYCECRVVAHTIAPELDNSATLGFRYTSQMIKDFQAYS